MTELRGLSEDEKRLVTHIMRWGSDGYPISKLRSGRGWIWSGFGNIKGPPTVFKTKRAAFDWFESYLDVLIDAHAGRI